MTTQTPAQALAPTPARPRTRTLVRHFVEMVVAMVVGMVALGPVWSAVWPSYGDRFEVMVLVMATDMAVAMAAWMLVRGHSRRVTAEMSAVMYLPFLLLFPPYWAGWVSGGVVMTAGHLLMLPAMAAVLWWRRDEHAH